SKKSPKLFTLTIYFLPKYASFTQMAMPNKAINTKQIKIGVILYQPKYANISELSLIVPSASIHTATESIENATPKAPLTNKAAPNIIFFIRPSPFISNTYIIYYILYCILLQHKTYIH